MSDSNWKFTKVADGIQASQGKRQIAADILDAYGINISAKRVLDVGAGNGDFLDVARERGALVVGVDYDPFVVRWLQLRGHQAFRCNILRSMRKLHQQRFDLIYVAGSIVADYFSLIGQWHLRQFLRRLDRYLANDGRILIYPYFNVTTPERIRIIRNPRACSFTKTMLSKGYQIMPYLPSLNERFPEYPLIFSRPLWERNRDEPPSFVVRGGQCVAEPGQNMI